MPFYQKKQSLCYYIHHINSIDGHYIYTEVSRKGTGHNAILHSPEMTSDGKKRCLDFFYHMYGNGMGSFKVEIEVDGLMTEMFKKSGNQANNWIQGLVNIDVPSGSKFRVSLKCISIQG